MNPTGVLGNGNQYLTGLVGLLVKQFVFKFPDGAFHHLIVAGGSHLGNQFLNQRMRHTELVQPGPQGGGENRFQLRNNLFIHHVVDSTGFLGFGNQPLDYLTGLVGFTVTVQEVKLKFTMI